MRSNDEILTISYNALDLTERVQAIEEARRLGRESAMSDCGSAGGVDVAHATDREYSSYVVQPILDTSDTITRDDIDPHLTDNDPRVQAFCRAWNEYVADRLADLAQA